MANSTATTARIRRCIREATIVSSTDPLVIASRRDAQDGQDSVIDGFFNKSAHAQAFINLRFAALSKVRRHETVECDEILGIGRTIPITPALPKVRLVDDAIGLDVSITIGAISVDWNIERNSIEAIG